MKCCTTVQTISMRMTIQIYHFILISWLYPTSSDSRFSDFTLKSTTLQPTWWLHFPIVNFPFISSNIPESQAYGVYISQLIRYSRAFIQWLSGQNSAADVRVTQTRLRCSYVDVIATNILRSLLQSGWT